MCILIGVIPSVLVARLASKQNICWLVGEPSMHAYQNGMQCKWSYIATLALQQSSKLLIKNNSLSTHIAIHCKFQSMHDYHNGHTKFKFSMTIVVILYDLHILGFTVYTSIYMPWLKNLKDKIGHWVLDLSNNFLIQMVMLFNITVQKVNYNAFCYNNYNMSVGLLGLTQLAPNRLYN